MTSRTLIAAALLAGFVLPCSAQEGRAQEGAPQEKPADPPAQRPIRNAPSPKALELASYIFSASNACGYKIGVPEFEALLAKQNVKPEDVSPRGPFGNRIQTMFALMSNQIMRNREQACLAVAGEYGPDGNIAKNVLQPMAAGEAPPESKSPEGKSPEGKSPEMVPAKPAE